MKLSNKVGPPVEGSDFFGREREIKETWDDLRDGNHLLITAPRRIGKSSLVKKLTATARSNKWNAAYIDVQDVTSEVEFYKVFAEALKKENESWYSRHKQQALDSLSRVFSKIELEFEAYETSVKLKWNGSLTNEIKAEIIKLLENSEDLLIAIDELPFFLARLEKQENGKQRISDFLHWLRAFRQKSHTRIRWIFCGSVGLDTFTQRLNLSEAFNDVLPYNIGAFDEPTATLFLSALGNDNDFPIDRPTAELILQKLGWPLPYFLQAHFKQLKRLKSTGVSPITAQDITQAYENIIRDHSSLKTWEERLNEQLSVNEADACKAVLKELCQTRKGLSRNKLFDVLYPLYNDKQTCEDSLAFTIDLLERDGYLVCDKRVYAFRSPLLRDYWFKIKIK